MNLELTCDEDAVVAEARRVFSKISPISRFRALGTTGRWQELVQAGWGDLGAGIEHGQLDLGTACGIFRAAGAHLLVDQFISSGLVLSALMAHLATKDRAQLSDRLSRRPGVLWGDGRRLDFPIDHEGSAVCFGVEDDVDLYRLSTDGEGGIRLGIAVSDDPVEVKKVAALSVGVGHINDSPDRWHDVPLALDSAGLARIGHNALLLHSAALIGASDAVLELTRCHTLSRMQFGVPIGSFQAVKHALADMLVADELAWSALLCAAADGATETEPLLTARVLTVEAALVSARTSAQFHGGIGFTWESDLHWYLKVLVDGVQRFGAVDDLAAKLGLLRIKAMTTC